MATRCVAARAGSVPTLVRLCREATRHGTVLSARRLASVASARPPKRSDASTAFTVGADRQRAVGRERGGGVHSER